MGVVPRSANAADLVEGVRTIATGVQHLHPLAVTAWLQGLQSSSRSVGGVEFSARECRVLEFIADGATNAAIASRLEVSVSTVKSYVAHLLTKLDASDRAQAVSIAIRRGVIS
jgi:DNA-binding NarL/FixJ family response regulator